MPLSLHLCVGDKLDIGNGALIVTVLDARSGTVRLTFTGDTDVKRIPRSATSVAADLEEGCKLNMRRVNYTRAGKRVVLP